MNQRDRVARAIYERYRPNHHANWDFISKNPDQSDFWREIAAAAIAAMPSTRGTRVTADWAPDYDGLELAKKLGLDVNDTLDVFLDYWIAQPGQKGVKLDWSATWRNWCRKAAKDEQRFSRSTKPLPGTTTRQFEPDPLKYGQPEGSWVRITKPHSYIWQTPDGIEETPR